MGKQMYEDTKLKIEATLKSYVQFYRVDYEVTIKEARKKRQNLKNKFGDMSKEMDTFHRPLLELPESLLVILNQVLSESELEFFWSKEGQRWFGKNFKEFSISKV